MQFSRPMKSKCVLFWLRRFTALQLWTVVWNEGKGVPRYSLRASNISAEKRKLKSVLVMHVEKRCGQPQAFKQRARDRCRRRRVQEKVIGTQGLYSGSEGTSWGKKDLHGNTKHCSIPLAQQSVSQACPFLKELPKFGAGEKSSARNQSQFWKAGIKRATTFAAPCTRYWDINSSFTALLSLSLNQLIKKPALSSTIKLLKYFSAMEFLLHKEKLCSHDIFYSHVKFCRYLPQETGNF